MAPHTPQPSSRPGKPGTLLEEWEHLLERRPKFRDTLEPLGQLIGAWVAWTGAGAPPPWSVEACRASWSRGEPLLATAPPDIAPDTVESLLAPALDILAGLDEDVQPFAQAWDRGEIDPAALFPGRGRIGSVAAQERAQLSQDALAFLSLAALRPVLEAYFAESRPHLVDSEWELGVCPWCGAPPGFADLLEGGRRQLACHLCGGSWTFARVGCPFCGHRVAADFARLVAEDADEGYAISACRTCRGYVKELDRRLRWNADGALVEDWGSPHLDLIAQRQEYWRPIPTVIQLVPRPS